MWLKISDVLEIIIIFLCLPGIMVISFIHEKKIIFNIIKGTSLIIHEEDICIGIGVLVQILLLILIFG